VRQIWLSHVIEAATPLYGCDGRILIEKDKEIVNGDSCNTSRISMPAHSGTHVDAPRHFIESGRTIDEIEAWEWIFNHPLLIDVPVTPGKLFPENDEFVMPDNKEIDFLIIRTGFERFRNKPVYWDNNPGIKVSFAVSMIKAYPNLRGVGLDCISISSIKHREEGRLAHRTLLEKGLVIIEDMNLSGFKSAILKSMIVSPLRFEDGDGAPCSVLGIFDN
jgi:arylformamidase